MQAFWLRLFGYGCSTVVLICITCPAITVATVILWALDRVRGRALGWLGPGSPKSQPHQALRGVAKLATGLASKHRQDVASGPVIHDFATAVGDSTPLKSLPVRTNTTLLRFMVRFCTLHHRKVGMSRNRTDLAV